MTLMDRVFQGSDDMYEIAVKAVDEAIAKFGEEANAALPNTAYCLPCLYAFSGEKFQTLGQVKNGALTFIKDFMTRNLRVHDVFTNGIATALSAEVIEAMKYVMNNGENPYTEKWEGYHGHLSDAEIRELGVPLVTDDIPGVAVLIGPAPTKEIAADLIKGYQSKGIMVFMTGGIIDQAREANVNMGYKIRVVPLGDELPSVIHVVSVAIRAALIFGAIPPGDFDGILKYTKDRVKAFVNAFAPLSHMTVGCGAGAIALGFPVITDEKENIWAIPKSLVLYDGYENYIPASIEARGIKLKITEMDIPISYASAFEGEIIRRANMQLEADGSREDSFELVRTLDASQVEDHKIEVIGKDFDEYDFGSRITMATIVEVAGRAMQDDFEPVIERKIHEYFNKLEGIMHTGQREMIRIRVSDSAFNAGFRAKHFGEVLWAAMKSEFDTIIDKLQVKIITDPEKVTELKNSIAMPTYEKRDDRLASLTDENVDRFFTCTMCQSFSPSHVCVVTPERLGLCGAVSWLDAQATNKLNPEGPCQPIIKGTPIDEHVGSWESVNETVHKYSQGALEKVTLYSIMEDPMTSCGCFECICGIEPMSNGVLIVNREFTGMTPIGMTFGDLASMTGGGVQTPGFMGHGKNFISSKKFMKADGGIERIVWMPKALKETVAEKLNATAKELYGIENFTDMIGDEETAPDEETLYAFLSEKGHPALGMEPLM